MCSLNDCISRFIFFLSGTVFVFIIFFFFWGGGVGGGCWAANMWIYWTCHVTTKRTKTNQIHALGLYKCIWFSTQTVARYVYLLVYKVQQDMKFNVVMKSWRKLTFYFGATCTYMYTSRLYVTKLMLHIESYDENQSLCNFNKGALFLHLGLNYPWAKPLPPTKKGTNHCTMQAIWKANSCYVKLHTCMNTQIQDSFCVKVYPNIGNVKGKIFTINVVKLNCVNRAHPIHVAHLQSHSTYIILCSDSLQFMHVAMTEDKYQLSHCLIVTQLYKHNHVTCTLTCFYINS